MRSPPLMYSMTKKRWSCVWKQLCMLVRKGDFFCSANTLRSFSVHSTSSSCTTKSFLRLLMAYTSFVVLCSARNTCGKCNIIISHGFRSNTVYAEIFVGEIFRGVKFSWLLDGRWLLSSEKSYACVDTTFTTTYGKLLLKKRWFV